MKATWKTWALAGLAAAASLAASPAEAAQQDAPDYFGEFRTPLQMVADPMYRRLRFIEFTDYVAYNSAFNIVSNDMVLLARHEYPILAYFMEHGRYRD
ncbi:MAG: hypothetical protein IJ631_05630 [Schwartzia sp.]|nr:hypothetical protein [Schwartzia sp. (in: firmicutes)]